MHATSPRVLSRAAFACHGSGQFDETSTEEAKALLGRPYCRIGWGQMTGFAAAFLAPAWADKYPSRRTSTSRCIRRQAED